jgi:hypothetical protein
MKGVCVGRRNDTSIVAFGVPAMQKRRQLNTTLSGNSPLPLPYYYNLSLTMLIIQSESPIDEDSMRHGNSLSTNQ